ncbi:MAG: PAS domain S-box protein, partial [Chlorobiales bacterium]|nr:PAS domain S-box protein [Chlorobiales bacterium]
MKKKLIVLLSEIEVTDKQVRLELEKSEEFHPYFVCTENEFVRMLNQIVPDLVVLDDAHPTISVEKSLSLLRKYRADVPFVILGTPEQKLPNDDNPSNALPLKIQSLLPQNGTPLVKPISPPESIPEFHRHFFEATSDLVWECHTDGTLVYANNAMCERFDYAPGSLTGKSLFSLIYHEDQRKFKSAFKDWVVGITPSSEETFRVREKSGYWRTVKILGTYCKAHPQPLSEIYIIAKDVSEEIHRDDWLQNVPPSLLDKLASHDADHAFIIIDRNFKVRAFNHLAKEWGKKFSGKVLQKGESIYDYIFEKVIGKFNERVEQALKGAHVIYEKNTTLPGGGEIWFEIHYVPVFDRAGKIVGVSLSYRNIEKKNDKADGKLEASQQYYRALVKTTSDITIIFESNGTIDHVSYSSEPILGYKPRELAGQNLFTYIHTDDIDFLKKAIQKALTNCDDKTQSELRFRHQASSWVHLDSGIECLSTEPALKDKVVLHAKNITERKQIEETLKVRNKAIEATLNGIIITDATQKDNPIIYVNPAFEKVTGYTAVEVIGKNPRFLHGTDREQPAILKFHEAIESGSSSKGVLRNYRKDGTLIWNEVMISPIINERGILTHFVGIKSDVTERMQADETLLQTNQLLTAISEIQSAFIADMEPGILFKSILDKFLLLTGSDYGFIGELSHGSKNSMALKIYSMQDNEEKLSNLITCNLNSKSCQKCGKLFSICSNIIASNQSFIAHDIELDNKHACLPQASSRIENLLGLPLFSGEELIGIAVTVKQTGSYDEAL